MVEKCWVKKPLIKPIATGATYNSSNALTLARICRLAWETDQTKVAKISSFWKGNHLFADMPDTDSQYLIFGTRNYTVVSFRATQSKMGDIWTVLKYKAYAPNPNYRGPTIYDHIPEGNAGFRESVADCFASGLVKDLRLFRAATGAQKSPLFLTGHSLGGGIALLARPKLKAEGFGVDSVYVYGCPVAVSPYKTEGHSMTTVSEYQAEFGSTTFFHRFEGDNVPRLRPINEWYSPPGWSRQLASNGMLKDYTKYRTLNIVTGGVWCIPWLTDMIHNHNLEISYLPALEKAAKGTQK